jgi:hypothetical protein
MKQLLLIAALATTCAIGCTTAQEEKDTDMAVEQNVISDQQKLDSAEAAINKLMESVSDDSVMKSIK